MSNFIPTFEKLFNNMNDFITNIDVESWIDNFKQSFESLKNIVINLLPILSGITTAFMVFTSLTKIISIVNTLKKAFMGISLITTLSNPILLVAAAIGLVVAACVYFYKTSEPFRNAINGMLSKLYEFGEWLGTVLPPIFKAICDWVTTNIIPIFQTLGSKIFEVWTNTLYPCISSLWENLQLLWTNILAPLGEFIMGVFLMYFITSFETIVNVFSTVVQASTEFVAGLIQEFSGIVDFIVGVFTGNWEQAWNGITNIFGGIFNAITGIAKGVINGIIDYINGAITGINNLGSVDLPIVGNVGLNIPTIPKFATGTSYFKGGLAQINERGGELVNLPNGSQVIPADKTDKLLNNKSSVNLNLTIQGNVVGNRQFINEMGQLLTDKILLALSNS